MRVIAQLLQAALGVWLMAAPAVLDFSGAPADHYRVAGPFVAALAIIAIGKCTRNVRLWVIPFALWMIVAPPVFGFPISALISGIVTGAAMLGLAFVKGNVRNRFGGGWKVLFQRDPYNLRNGLSGSGQIE